MSMGSVDQARTARRRTFRFPCWQEEGLFARDVDGHLIRMDKVTAADFDRDVTLTIDGQPITVKKAVPATDSQGNVLQGRRRAGPSPGRPRSTTRRRQLFTDDSGAAIRSRSSATATTWTRWPSAGSAWSRSPRRSAARSQPERKLLPACQHRVEETMQVQTVASPDAEPQASGSASAVTMLTELLMADHPTPCAKETQNAATASSRRWRGGSRSARPGSPPAEPSGPSDDSSLVIAVDHNACILCDRCVRGCNDIRDNQVIGRMGKGYTARIAFDLDDADGQLVVRLLRRVHGLLPDRRADPPRGRRGRPWKD